MKFGSILAVTLALTLGATAGLIEYDSFAEASGDLWIYGPDSAGAAGSGVETYAGPGSAHPATITFYDGITPVSGGSWSGAGGGSTIFARIDITGGAYTGYYYIMDSQLIVSPDVAAQPAFYTSGGTNPGGSGWLVPEPGTWALFGVGLVVLMQARRRRR